MLLYIRVAQGVLACAVFTIAWRILLRLVSKTDIDNIPAPVSPSLLKGNFSQLFNDNAWAFHVELGQKFGGMVRINMPLGIKFLYVSDPKALYHIVLKDQNVFQKSLSSFITNSLLYGDGLLSTFGDRHRKQRKMLNPVFSTAHLREMVPIFYEVTDRLNHTLESKVADGIQEIDVLRWLSRTALELVARSGLGCSMDPLADDLDVHPVSVAVKQIPTAISPVVIFQMFLPLLVKLGPPGFRRFIVDLLPFRDVKRLRHIVDVMHNASIEIFEAKKRALHEGGKSKTGKAQDIIGALMQGNMQALEEDKLSDSEIVGQMSTFLFAATDTTSSALSRILYLLAEHPEVQGKLQEEITCAIQENGGQDLLYDELVSLPFLDAICRETLRLFPPLTMQARSAQQDAVVPLSTPVMGIDGREMHEIVVPKGTTILISILNSNRDPALWGPDSCEWKPERWLSPLPDPVIDTPTPGVYSNMMTFMGGARACIGVKYSILEMKVVLCGLLSKFRFALPDKEIVWEMSFIATPVEKGRPGVPSMPLKVIALNDDAE